eukprot:365210-Chlamydomonas_euryale.AAC.4
MAPIEVRRRLSRVVPLLPGPAQAPSPLPPRAAVSCACSIMICAAALALVASSCACSAATAADAERDVTRASSSSCSRLPVPTAEMARACVGALDWGRGSPALSGGGAAATAPPQLLLPKTSALAVRFAPGTACAGAAVAAAAPGQLPRGVERSAGPVLELQPSSRTA